MLSGYATNALLRVTTGPVGREQTTSAVLVEITMDGGQCLFDVPPLLNATMKVSIDGFRMIPAKARVSAHVGRSGQQTRVAFKLEDLCWPYEIFAELATRSLAKMQQEEIIPACFAELGLSKSCTVDDIERAYYRKVRKVHPDRGGSVEAFMKLRHAYLEALKQAKPS